MIEHKRIGRTIFYLSLSIFFFAVFSTSNALSLNLEQIDAMFKKKGELTDLQWEDYINGLKGQKITLKGKAFEVDEKGFIRKSALVHLADEDSELKFYAACRTDINTGLKIKKDQHYSINGVIKDVEYKYAVRVSDLLFSMWGPISRWLSDKPASGYFLQLEDCKIIK